MDTHTYNLSLTWKEGRIGEMSYSMTEITLKPVLVIDDETKRDRALRILDKAEAACLISNSIKTIVKLDPTVQVSVLA